MIFIPENGRLGNQLFQYFGLRKYFPNQKLVFLGFDEINQYFDGIQGKFISKNRLKKSLLLRRMPKILFWLAGVRIIGSITECNREFSYSIKKRKGVLPNMYVFKGFFQHKDPISLITDIPELKPELVSEAEEWLISKGVFTPKKELVFVHIRRDDYLSWPSREYPGVLNVEWYNRAMEEIRMKVDNPVFVLMSDDQYYLRDLFEESDSLIISSNTAPVDFAIMSICSHGILSPSTFAWWGANMARYRHFDSKNAIFIAPKYWGGHRKKVWHPAHYITNWLIYFE